MNPFDLPGPAFLLFYSVFAGAVLLALSFAVDSPGGSASAARFKMADPYAIALLRDGERTLICVVLLSLMDRGLVAVQDGAFQITERGRAHAGRSGIDGAVLQVLLQPRPASSIEAIAHETAVQRHIKALNTDLESLGMLSTPRELGRRATLGSVAKACLVGVAVIKGGLAIMRGHSNIGFLVLLAAGATRLAGKLARPPASSARTRAGTVLVVRLQDIYRDLLRRADTLRPGDLDLILLAAVYGVSRVPLGSAPHASLLLPLAPALRFTNAGSGTSDAASCGVGDGCGGDGGGCGGCGGH